MRSIVSLIVLAVLVSYATAQTTSQKLAKLRAESKLQIESLADIVGEVSNDTAKANIVAENAQRDANAALSMATALKGKVDNIERMVVTLTTKFDAAANNVAEVGKDWAGDPVFGPAMSRQTMTMSSYSGMNGMMARNGRFMERLRERPRFRVRVVAGNGAFRASGMGG